MKLPDNIQNPEEILRRWQKRRNIPEYVYIRVKEFLDKAAAIDAENFKMQIEKKKAA